MNIVAEIERRFSLLYRSTHRLATVVGNTSNEVQVTWNTPGGDMTRTFPKLSGVTVIADDIVMMVDATGNGGWVVIGKVIHN
jgi:hypothetical protein